MVGGATGGSFEQRMTELGKLVGTGKIQTKVRFAQAYAARQERSDFYDHPRGGKAHFLRDALLSAHKEHIQRVAQELFRGNTQVRYIQLGEKVAEKAAGDAPVELANLRRSGAIKVLVGGRTIYERPAQQRRLTRRELNDRVRARHFDQLRHRFNR
jgi:hypothetical protein